VNEEGTLAVYNWMTHWASTVLVAGEVAQRAERITQKTNSHKKVKKKKPGKFKAESHSDYTAGSRPKIHF
jgi:hypothetical protein